MSDFDTNPTGHSGMSPPTDSTFEHDEEGSRSRWPTVIGVISIIYALLGLLCQVGAVAWVFFSETFMNMAGMDLDMPPIIKLLSMVLAALTFAAGLFLLIGSINLLRRRRNGPKLMKVWVVLRLILVLIGAAAGFFMLDANVDMQLQIQEAQNQRMVEAGRPELVQNRTKDSLRRQAIIQTAIMSGVVAIYPLFLGFYLSREKIRTEVETWE